MNRHPPPTLVNGKNKNEKYKTVRSFFRNLNFESRPLFRLVIRGVELKKTQTLSFKQNEG